MPKNQVSHLITDQEMHFARLVHTGTMTGRNAAQAAGLSPETAAHIKDKPRVQTPKGSNFTKLPGRMNQREDFI